MALPQARAEKDLAIEREEYEDLRQQLEVASRGEESESESEESEESEQSMHSDDEEDDEIDAQVGELAEKMQQIRTKIQQGGSIYLDLSGVHCLMFCCTM